ncbi:MAG: hypothetical protein ACOH2L_19055 [Devosia sp.]
MTRLAGVLMMAVALGGSFAAPAQAQRLGLFFGDERSDFFPQRISCLNDYQIRQAVAELGYRDIYLNVPNQKHIEVRASMGDWVYLLDFNYCSAQVESRTKLRPAG